VSNIKARLPSTEDSLLVFGGCVFIIHIWAVINLLDVLPSWTLRLDWFDLLGVVSYPMAFALFESLVVWALLILIAVVLPQPFLRKDFLSQGMAIVIFTAILSILLTYYYGTILLYIRLLPFVLAISIAVSVLLSYQIGRLKKINILMYALFKRVFVLSMLYVFIDLLGVLVITVRNIWG
jgi:hypothetical protein